jgi:hypothetical protein
MLELELELELESGLGLESVLGLELEFEVEFVRIKSQLKLEFRFSSVRNISKSPSLVTSYEVLYLRNNEDNICIRPLEDIGSA